MPRIFPVHAKDDGREWVCCAIYFPLISDKKRQKHLWIFALLWCKGWSGLSGSDWNVFFIYTDLFFNRNWQPNDHHGFYGPVEQSIAFQFCFKSVLTFPDSGRKVMQWCNLKYMNFNLWREKKPHQSRKMILKLKIADSSCMEVIVMTWDYE